jgi:tetratricopeptide (TPR) repeat protein
MSLAIALGLSLAAVPALGQSPDKLLTDAQQLLAAGNPKQAFVLLAPQQAKYGGNQEYDYLLGLSALDSGKIDDAIIALERVLARDARNAGALMELGRAYFAAGSLDLAEATFNQLRLNNPPAPAAQAIERYLQAIAQRRAAGKKAVYAWGETSLGYDTNITGVPKDFTAAVVSAFNIPGVDPTGNSIKRRAPYVGAAAGIDMVVPINSSWSGFAGAELRARAYRRQADFNSTYGEARTGLSWQSGAHGARFSVSGNRFDQDGQAPGDPKPTNDRKTGTAAAEYHYALSDNQQLTAGLSGSWVRFPRNDIEDFNAIGVNGSWLRSFAGNGSPVLQISGFYSRDEAERKLADGVSDKSKRVGGIRGYVQYSLSERLSLFNSLGYSQRKDQSAFARATEIEFGRDRLADLTLGVNWRFQPKCLMRAQWYGSRNDSNIAIYDYTRNEVSSNIRCDFQ